VLTRGDDGAWTSVRVRPGETARLASIGAELDVREVYAASQQPA
jgi:hypothetical protein